MRNHAAVPQERRTGKSPALNLPAQQAKPRFHILEDSFLLGYIFSKNTEKLCGFWKNGTSSKQSSRAFRKRRACGGGRDEIGNGRGALEKALHETSLCVFLSSGMWILLDTGIQPEFGRRISCCVG